MSDNILEKKIGKQVKQTPIVSVIIPAYNVAEFIAETLNSIFAQTFQNYEIVLVNDGSPDTAELEKTLLPYLEKIVYIKQNNAGTAAARNTAIKNSCGEFLAFLDGDDVWLPEYLESQIEALNSKKCDLIYADALLFGDVRDAGETYMRKSHSNGAVTTESLIAAECNVITSGTFVKRETIVEAGFFDEELPRIGMEDFDLWFRLAKSGGKLAYQKKVLLKYRVRAGSLSGSSIQRAEREIIALDIISRKYELNASEKVAFQNQKNKAVAELEIVKGKINIANEKYQDALENFRAANRYYHKFKLTALTWLLRINPQIARRVTASKLSVEFPSAK